MKDELTLEILDEAIGQLPPITYPRQIRISYGDYQRMREACDMLEIFLEQTDGVSLGMLGERIVSDKNIADNHYEVDF